MKRNQFKNERGAIMLEGILCILTTTFVLFFLLSLGFYLYQHTLVQIVVNEIAEDIVTTYKFQDIDDCSEITADDVEDLGRYRYLIFSNTYLTENEKKGVELAKKRLKMTSLAKAKSDPEVDIEVKKDAVGRMHYKVTLEQKYEFLLEGILKVVGLQDKETISAVAYVESVDVSNYINTVKMESYAVEKFLGIFPLTSMIESMVNLIKSFLKLLS